MTIEQAAVKALSYLNLRDDLAIDITDIAITSIIGYAAFRRIISSGDFPEDKELDLLTLKYEIENTNINELVRDFLKENEDDNKNNEQ